LIRTAFILANAALSVIFVHTGITLYLTGAAAWDAGVLPLFLAFWTAFAGAGLWYRNIWLVSMAAMSLIGLTLLYLFVFGLAEVQEGLAISDSDVRIFFGCLGLIGFTIAFETHAIRQHLRARRTGTCA
jgi:hypothetical protein